MDNSSWEYIPKLLGTSIAEHDRMNWHDRFASVLFNTKVKKRIQLDPSWTLLHQPNAGYPHAHTEVEPQVFLAEITKPITKPMLESSGIKAGIWENSQIPHSWKTFPLKFNILPGYVKIAIENDHL